ncbi:MAG: tRNA pseudouridine(38-40) synthase TruA [Ignavibacteriales bacterium]|nr:tRNA pseudouridine(38-40) synthase TruA [Ignavibacteriales bacterium]
MQNVKLELEYDGSDFVGWQYQENGRSVQGELERALKQVLQEEVRVIGAGRTDAGVHARGQVANFRTAAGINEQSLIKSLNGVLPKDVAVLSVNRVDENFHSRYSAKARQYKYYIHLRATALSRKYCWSMSYKLDIAVMRECAKMIVGEHDFSSFCKSQSSVEHHRCTVLSSSWESRDSILEFEITANRFLHGMVRALVGTMVEIGRGYRHLEEFPQILNARDRARAGMAAPPHGLFLEHIIY